jgi:hypothetical protein
MQKSETHLQSVKDVLKSVWPCDIYFEIFEFKVVNLVWKCYPIFFSGHHIGFKINFNLNWLYIICFLRVLLFPLPIKRNIYNPVKNSLLISKDILFMNKIYNLYIYNFNKNGKNRGRKDIWCAKSEIIFSNLNVYCIENQ